MRSSRRHHEPLDEVAADFQPALMADIELSRPLRLVACEPARSSAPYERAIVLARLHTHPLGVVEIPGRPRDLDPADLSAHVWRSLRHEITEHLRLDGCAEVGGLPPGGYAGSSSPPCLEQRRRTLGRATPMSVVVPTHERPGRLEACLRSLLALEYPRYEVLVVDNAPKTAATQEVVERLSAGATVPITYLREDRPGASAARNRGLRQASAELVAFADDDVIVDPNWLAAIAEAFEATEDVGCVTGPVLPLQYETRAQAWMEQFAQFRTGFSRELFDLGRHRSQRPLYPYNPGVFGSGGSMAFTRAALEEAGGFDTALGPATRARAGEELAAFLAVILRRHRIVFEPGAVVRHAEVLDYDTLRDRVHAYGVGLGAYLTKTLMDHPRLALDLGAKLPYGVYLMVSSRSPKHVRQRSDFPRELNAVEMGGMLSGPVAYLVARSLSRRR